jgi:hypothetical protein
MNIIVLNNLYPRGRGRGREDPGHVSCPVFYSKRNLIALLIRYWR